MAQHSDIHTDKHTNSNCHHDEVLPEVSVHVVHDHVGNLETPSPLGRAKKQVGHQTPAGDGR